MGIYTKSLEKLINELEKMPGVGPKSAQRIAFYLLKIEKQESDDLANAILKVKETIRFCSLCNNVTENPGLCDICEDDARDHSVVCVVEHPKDIIALEKIRGFKGVYHVLMGALSPLDNIGPDELKIKELVARVSKNNIQEVIVATNPNVEGETTSLYLSKILKIFNVKVTRLAYGLPIGGDLEYADEVTLSHALEGRKEI